MSAHLHAKDRLALWNKTAECWCNLQLNRMIHYSLRSAWLFSNAERCMLHGNWDHCKLQLSVHLGQPLRRGKLAPLRVQWMTFILNFSSCFWYSFCGQLQRHEPSKRSKKFHNWKSFLIWLANLFNAEPSWNFPEIVNGVELLEVDCRTSASRTTAPFAAWTLCGYALAAAEESAMDQELISQCGSGGILCGLCSAGAVLWLKF